MLADVTSLIMRDVPLLLLGVVSPPPLHPSHPGNVGLGSVRGDSVRGSRLPPPRGH